MFFPDSDEVISLGSDKLKFVGHGPLVHQRSGTKVDIEAGAPNRRGAILC
jgi:hypothetical protein